MSHAEIKRYDIGSLLPMNKCYDSEHALTQDDVDEVNAMVAHIESTRSDTIPKPGDRMILTTRLGDYYQHALIEKNIEEDKLYVCSIPYVPFAYPTANGVSLCVSGGQFTRIPLNKVRYAGTVPGYFQLWGHNGSVGNGSVEFKATVSLWEYEEPEPLFGDFTTRTWRKIHFTKTEHPAADGYLYRSEEIIIPDEESFQRFLNNYCGTVFPGYNNTSWVVWCYREEFIGISPDNWNSMIETAEFRRDRTLMREVKIRKDLKNHIVYCYYMKA